MEVKEPLIPEIAESYVIWHPVKGYYARLLSMSNQIMYTAQLPESHSFYNKRFAQVYLDKLASISFKTLEQMNEFTNTHKIRKVITCLDD